MHLPYGDFQPLERLSVTSFLSETAQALGPPKPLASLNHENVYFDGDQEPGTAMPPIPGTDGGITHTCAAAVPVNTHAQWL